MRILLPVIFSLFPQNADKRCAAKGDYGTADHQQRQDMDIRFKIVGIIEIAYHQDGTAKENHHQKYGYNSVIRALG